MNDLIKAGGPAFPVSTSDTTAGHQDGHTTWQFPGMTLRDYFAAKALPEIFAEQLRNKVDNPKSAAEWAYRIADAMLAAREE